MAASNKCKTLTDGSFVRFDLSVYLKGDSVTQVYVVGVRTHTHNMTIPDCLCSDENMKV